MRAKKSLCLVAAAAVWTACAWAIDVNIENPAGAIAVRVQMGAATVSVQSHAIGRETRASDVQRTDTASRTTIVCRPADGARVDLDVVVPHTALVKAATVGGAISLAGMVRGASLRTDTGAITVTTPWELARLRMLAREAPRDVRHPKGPGIAFVRGKLKDYWAFANWRPSAVDRLGDPLGDGWARGWEDTFTTVEIVAAKPERLELVQMAVPEDSWVRPHTQAAPLLPEVWRRFKTGAAKPAAAATTAIAGQGADFRSDVHLVTLAVPVHDSNGRPVARLTADDFDLTEDNQPQSIAFAKTGETPFHLILFLDLSKSSYISRPLVVDAARKFIDIAEARDRIAIHVLSNSLFHVASPLTADRTLLRKLIDTIPDVSGGSPIFDSMVLSVMQEPLRAAGEHLAMVILTDGMDNQFESPERGSRIPLVKLRAAAAEWPLPIYTLLTPYEQPALQQTRGRRAMEQLSDSSGGQMFDVQSLADLPSAYAKVVADLRSVYTIAYYPSNQNFRGDWRTIRLRAKKPGLTLRTRPGYRAW